MVFRDLLKRYRPECRREGRVCPQIDGVGNGNQMIGWRLIAGFGGLSPGGVPGITVDDPAFAVEMPQHAEVRWGETPPSRYRQDRNLA